MLEEVVSDPVRLDDAPIEGIADAVGRGDQLEIRPSAVEATRERPQVAVDDAGGRVLEQRSVLVRTAVPERVRRIREPREERGAGRGCHDGDGATIGACERRVATHASATPIAMKINPAAWGRSAAPCATVVQRRGHERPADEDGRDVNRLRAGECRVPARNVRRTGARR